MDAEKITALVQAQQNRFIKNLEYDQSLVTMTDTGPVAVINGEEIPLLDEPFDLQIVQPGHANKNKALNPFIGKILIKYSNENMGENDAASEMTLLPITIVNYGFRNYGPYDDKGSEDGNRLLCYSTNGVYPSERVIAPRSSVCAEIVLRNGEYQRNVVCPHAQWNNNEKPECRTVVTLGLFDLERKIPLRLQLHGTALGAWNSLQRSYRQARNVARLKKKSINDYVIKLSVERNGTYVTPVFKLMEADASLGKPSDYLPVCKYYMEHLFSRQPDTAGETASVAPAITAAEATEEDMKAVADGRDFTV